MKKLKIVMYFSIIVFTVLGASFGQTIQYGSPGIEVLYKGSNAWCTIVIMGDGYTQAEQAKFAGHAVKSKQAILNTFPYNKYKSSLAIYKINLISKDSGVDYSRSQNKKRTALEGFYYGRAVLINPNLLRKVLQKFSSQLGNMKYVYPLVLVNSTRHGGVTSMSYYYRYASSCTSSRLPHIVVHELGHLIFRLADEYDYGRSGTYHGSEPPYSNVSANGNPYTVKWSFITQTAFEGAMYYKKGVWRPQKYCRMRTWVNYFCKVCNFAAEYYFQNKKPLFIRPGHTYTLANNGNGNNSSNNGNNNNGGGNNSSNNGGGNNSSNNGNNSNNGNGTSTSGGSHPNNTRPKPSLNRPKPNQPRPKKVVVVVRGRPIVVSLGNNKSKK